MHISDMAMFWFRLHFKIIFYLESAFGQVPDTFVIDDIRCNGNEARLIDCPHSSTDDCSAGEGAGVKCY